MKTLSDLFPARPVFTSAIRRAYARRRSYHFRAAVNRRPAGARVSLSLLRSLWQSAGVRAPSGL